MSPGAPDLTPFPPPSNPGRVGASFRVSNRLASHKNGAVPRRRNPRSNQGRQTEEHRMAGLGSHWRADGFPKTAYGSQADALTAALVRRQESGVELNVYRCDVCSAWHMGNPRRREGSTR